ncbi:MAG: sulfoxide reductase heme-binding subunit YedZ [Betaproteobacteria bacterium]|nr:sulfoxide reductase heme-binding subunit YedZ [Betaproteobacteria bacterium]NBY05310.1 sulfoxide reductase heme-binding subunit YedZ [Betaproteobacteria bacterium]
MWRHPATKPLLAALLAVPFIWLLLAAVNDALGPNPAEALIRQTGDWSLRALCLALAVTPLRVITGQAALMRFRRMIGVNVFVYALTHLLCYAWLDMGWDWSDVAGDIAKRPFILVGFLALVLLASLAATSFNRAVRWLGPKRWQALHRMVYAVAALGVLHFYWMREGKNNQTEVWVYGGILASLLAWRGWYWWRNSHNASALKSQPSR